MEKSEMTYSKFDPLNGEQVQLPVRARAAIVQEARIRRAYSIEDLAVASGLTAAEIMGIEAGVNANPDYFRRIARVLALPLQ
jgi:Helix-turn-helix